MIDINDLRFSAANSVRDLALLPSEVLELLDRLEAAEAERDWHAERCEDAMNECDVLRAKIEQSEQMERQEPIAYRGKVPDGWPTEEMTTAFARVFNVRDQYGTFPQAFRAALVVAPEVKL